MLYPPPGVEVPLAGISCQKVFDDDGRIALCDKSPCQEGSAGGGGGVAPPTTPTVWEAPEGDGHGSEQGSCDLREADCVCPADWVERYTLDYLWCWTPTDDPEPDPETTAAAEAAAAEEERLRLEAAAAEEERLRLEAAAAEEERLRLEAAAAEAERLRQEEAAAEAERLSWTCSGGFDYPPPGRRLTDGRCSESWNTSETGRNYVTCSKSPCNQGNVESEADPKARCEAQEGRVWVDDSLSVQNTHGHYQRTGHCWSRARICNVGVDYPPGTTLAGDPIPCPE